MYIFVFIGADGQCWFPYVFEGDSYDSCITAGDHAGGKPWCAMTPNMDTDGLWGECVKADDGKDSTDQTDNKDETEDDNKDETDDDNKDKEDSGSGMPTIGGTGNGCKCQFPFVYNGKSYDSCTTVDHGQPWCSCEVIYEEGRWGNCKIRKLSS